MALALAEGADLIWMMDDDTVPEPGALRALIEARQNYPGRPPVLVASKVVWTDGREHPMNTPRRRPLATRSELHAADQAGCIPIRSASFVSILVEAAECRVRGLPRADFFLWNDDFEFTTRLLRDRVGLLCPASVVVHKTRAFGGADADPGDRFFYEVRNKIWTLRTPSLAPGERVLYTGATVRRWIRTYRGASDRRAIRSCLKSGIAAGVRTSPRPNEQVLPPVGDHLGAAPAAGGPCRDARPGRRSWSASCWPRRAGLGGGLRNRRAGLRNRRAGLRPGCPCLRIRRCRAWPAALAAALLRPDSGRRGCRRGRRRGR